MQISQLLRNRAFRFNEAADSVCFEWSLAIGSSGVCSPCDRNEFNRLVKIKMAATECESVTAVQTNFSEANTHVLRKLSA